MVDLPAWVVETPRQDRHWVLFVVEVCDLALHERVDKFAKT